MRFKADEQSFGCLVFSVAFSAPMSFRPSSDSACSRLSVSVQGKTAGHQVQSGGEYV
jgi:hypothetical protein